MDPKGWIRSVIEGWRTGKIGELWAIIYNTWQHTTMRYFPWLSDKLARTPFWLQATAAMLIVTTGSFAWARLTPPDIDGQWRIKGAGNASGNPVGGTCDMHRVQEWI